MSWRNQRRQLKQATRETQADLMTFGEELHRLDADVAGRTLDGAARQEHQRALDAREDAERSLRAARGPDEIRHITSILDEGRYALSCLQARLAGRPVPERRPPCFFDPAHGPATRDVDWAPPGGPARRVPACAADADRARTGAPPLVRTVRHRSRRVPYWDAGPGCLPWLQGYYASWGGLDQLTGGLLTGSALSTSQTYLGLRSTAETDVAADGRHRGAGSSPPDIDRADSGPGSI
jgi:hypothetical protein